MPFATRLRAYFLAGILVTAPIGMTLYLTRLIIDFVDSRVRPLIPTRYNPESYLPFGIAGLGVIVAMALLTLVGALTAGPVGRWVVRLFDRLLLQRMPVVRNVYGALKQILETVLAQQSKAFRQVVMVEYRRRGIWSLGFVTGETVGEVQHMTEDDVLNVVPADHAEPDLGLPAVRPALRCPCPRNDRRGRDRDGGVGRYHHAAPPLLQIAADRTMG